MADPVKYERGYSFAGFQAINPSRPLPGPEMDNELEGVEDSLASIIEALADIRRSDGNIENGIVNFDSLDDDVKALIVNDDERIVVGDINPAAFATLSEAQSATANDKLMTPVRVRNSIQTLRPFASQSQAQAGTDSGSVMTPRRSSQQLDALRGFASQAQAEAGTNNATVMTPRRTADYVSEARPYVTAIVELSLGEIPAGDEVSQTFTVSGAQEFDAVLLGFRPAGNGIGARLAASAWVTEPGSVRVRVFNSGSSSFTFATQDIRIALFR